ncbi:MAG: restriction endonuclease [Bacteroidales bacterium]|nr:restriction endonuclease [Bacteroidales bacterium]
MNKWLQLSLEYAKTKAYLDDLYAVYPTIPDGIRCMDEEKFSKVENAYKLRDNKKLIKSLLALELFPIKDSYVSYLRRDSSAIERNPETIDRLSGILYDWGIDKIYERCCEPKEANRKMGPKFKEWVNSKALGVDPVCIDDFLANDDNAILSGSDEEMKDFAKSLGYSRNKGLDFVARWHGKYILGEAKFLTDNGGHQNAQFEDAISTLTCPHVNAIMIAILDGVLYIESREKMYRSITGTYENRNIMSALLLRNFLYSIPK